MWYKLSDLFDLQMGKTPSRNNPNYWNSKDYLWVSISDMSGYDKYVSSAKEYISERAVKESGIKTIPANTVIMSFKLSIGKTAITTESIFSNEAIMAFIDKKTTAIDPEYIFYLFSGKDWDEGSNKAVMGKTLNKVTLSNTEVDIPSLDIQKERVDKLNKISTLIADKKQQLNQLDELVKARFVEMFGLPGTDPFGYGKVKLGECCEINPKKTKNARLADGVEVSFAPMSSVSEKGEIDPSDIRKYEAVKKGFTYFTENDVLFAKITPCMENGKGAIAKGLMNGIGFGSTEFRVLRSTHGLSNPYWIYTITSFKTFRKDAESNMTGSAGQRRTPASFLEGYEISLPPIELQNQFATFVAQIDKSKFALQNSIINLMNLWYNTNSMFCERTYGEA